MNAPAVNRTLGLYGSVLKVGVTRGVVTLSTPDIVKQFPGPSLPKLMAQFRFAFRFSYWCMLSPQPYTRTVPVLGRTVATLRPALARMPRRSTV